MTYKMKCYLIVLLFFCFVVRLHAQQEKKSHEKPRFGFKAGVNFNKVKDAGSINGENKSGFSAGVFFTPADKGFLGYRTEFVFSRQGYDFKTSSTTGAVKLNYILLPQLTTLNITKYIQLQAGGQIGFLLNASVDSMSSLSTTPGSQPNEYFSRFTYGLAAGLELYPHRNILLGGRFNLNIAAVNKEALPGRQPSYLPTDSKQLYNNVVQLYAGFRF